MRILALEPYYGGSHKSFLDGWSACSRHDFTVLALPAHHWKWRMRHSPVTFMEQLELRGDDPSGYDMLWCSSMLDLATFKGLWPSPPADLPCAVYFHENQFFYPVRSRDERDVHFGITNLTTALSATEVWFNSCFNRTTFLDGINILSRQVSDYPVHASGEAILKKSHILPPGIDPISSPVGRSEGPLRILWVGRWEHDKNPEDFYGAMKLLESRGLDFRLIVLGESYQEVPDVFTEIAESFAGRLLHFGYEPDDVSYRRLLSESDVVVSTSHHEFFGLAILEAFSAGCVPVLPYRLVYPELYDRGVYFFDGSPVGLADELSAIGERLVHVRADRARQIYSRSIAGRFGWDIIGPRLDGAAERVAGIGE